MVPRLDRCAWALAASDSGIVSFRVTRSQLQHNIDSEACGFYNRAGNDESPPMGRVHLQPQPSIDNLGG